jgi:hypothetical protein
LWLRLRARLLYRLRPWLLLWVELGSRLLYLLRSWLRHRLRSWLLNLLRMDLLPRLLDLRLRPWLLHRLRVELRPRLLSRLLLSLRAHRLPLLWMELRLLCALRNLRLAGSARRVRLRVEPGSRLLPERLPLRLSLRLPLRLSLPLIRTTAALLRDRRMRLRPRRLAALALRLITRLRSRVAGRVSSARAARELRRPRHAVTRPYRCIRLLPSGAGLRRHRRAALHGHTGSERLRMDCSIGLTARLTIRLAVRLAPRPTVGDTDLRRHAGPLHRRGAALHRARPARGDQPHIRLRPTGVADPAPTEMRGH